MRFLPPTTKAPLTLPPEPTPLVSWACYDPAGFSVELTERDLLSHVLLLGATGAGKTTLLTQAMRQLINRPRSQPVGLLIFDPKVDGTVEMARALARAARREQDLVVLGPEGDHRFDLFGRLRSLADVDFLTRRLLVGTQSMGPHNTYWDEARYAMLNAAMTLLVTGHARVPFERAAEFLRSWFFNLRTAPKIVAQTVAGTRQFLSDPDATPAMLRQVQNALDQVELWKELDQRTRSNLQSCLINALRPLLSVVAAQCFEGTARPAFDPGRVATEGKICVVSLNALAEPQLAQLLFRLVRQDFFEAVQHRQGTGHGLCGVIADEFPLLAVPADAEQLATVRAKRCFIMAAAQGLAGLDETLGERCRRAMLLNFNTVVFLRSREEETAEMAFTTLGLRQERWKRRRQTGTDYGSVALLGHQPAAEYIRALRPVCPPGTLGCLEPHQGFVLQADGRRTEYTLWFVPWFEDASFPRPSGDKPMARLPREEVTELASADYVHQLMTRRSRKPLWPPEVVLAATELCRPVPTRASIIDAVESFFRSKACRLHLVPKGLKRLPLCWLAAIPNILWRLRRPHWAHLPFRIDVLRVREGVLVVSFAQEEQPDLSCITRWDDIRLVLNLSVYPSIWRPLRRRHFVELWAKQPDLRPALRAGQPEVL
jgi:hypothetical protein